jgi:hypothetical protein
VSTDGDPAPSGIDAKWAALSPPAAGQGPLMRSRRHGMFQAAIQRAIQYVVYFARAAKYSILTVAKASMFDDLDRMPDVKTIQKQSRYVFSAFLLAVNIVAFLTINVYVDNVIDTIRNAVCDSYA